MIRDRWKIGYANVLAPDELEKWLRSGWEPFAVVRHNEGDRLYFRRGVREEVADDKDAES